MCRPFGVSQEVAKRRCALSNDKRSGLGRTPMVLVGDAEVAAHEIVVPRGKVGVAFEVDMERVLIWLASLEGHRCGQGERHTLTRIEAAAERLDVLPR